MSIVSGVFAWRKSRTEAEGKARARGQVDRFPTHARVALPDGNIVLVRVASLSAAKDLLAAQRAAERKLAQRRDARMLSEVARIVENAERAPLDGAR